MVGVTAVSDAGRDRAEAMLPGAPVLATPDLVERSELVLLAVPDDQLAELVRGLADDGDLAARAARRAHQPGPRRRCARTGARGRRDPLAIHRRWRSRARAST